MRGSHIVTKRLFDHDKCYFLQGSDGRIVFMIPYETDFTLIGTTDVDHGAADTAPECTDDERDYMIDFVNGYLKNPISAADVVWTYSGVRPLYSDGSGRASEATRDYVLRMDRNMGAPALNIFGGKLTTYRRLAERAVGEVAAELKGAIRPVDGGRAASRRRLSGGRIRGARVRAWRRVRIPERCLGPQARAGLRHGRAGRHGGRRER